jgi:hypothetical protein
LKRGEVWRLDRYKNRLQLKWRIKGEASSCAFSHGLEFGVNRFVDSTANSLRCCIRWVSPFMLF